jgi:hypothetical protein
VASKCPLNYYTVDMIGQLDVRGPLGQLFDRSKGEVGRPTGVCKVTGMKEPCMGIGNL